MKRFIISVVLMFVFVSGNAFAQNDFSAQGSTAVTGLYYFWSSNNHFATPAIYLTNLSSVPVQCRVVYYDHDGNELTYHAATFTSGVSGGRQIASGSDFEIPPKGTRVNALKMPSSKIYAYSYAVVQWKSEQDPQLRNALIGGVEITRFNRSVGVAQPKFNLNNGAPF